jgi:phosphoenolpyruvate---glycerone phosphotransferase subunit DhaM
MVGIVLISHSRVVAESTAEMVGHIAAGAKVVPAGGTDDGRLGTSTERIAAAIAEADTGDGVLLIPDIGSSVFSALALLEEFESATRVVLADAPFVEGAVAAAVAAGVGLDLTEVHLAAEEAREIRKL